MGLEPGARASSGLCLSLFLVLSASSIPLWFLAALGLHFHSCSLDRKSSK